VLEIRKLNQYYGETHILWDVDLEVEPAMCTCVMGRNGVGKTTLLKTIMGLLPAASGELTLEGASLARNAAEMRPRLGIGYVPQGREIFGQLSVAENLQVALSTRGLSIRSGRAAAILAKVFGWFPVLKDMLHRRGGDLSGGQQQQLAIARALVLEPKLLILDEPTEGIQPNIVSLIGDILERLREEERMTILLVEQKLPFARRVAQRFCILDRGRSVASGAMTALDETLIGRHLAV
jgi:urea transport system ATP-binding protein